jgi:glutamate-1-semialdehyde 2,1-aminomutase
MKLSLTQARYQQAKQIIPGGTQLLSKRPEMMAPELWPAYFTQAKGCEITDLDGRRWLDFSTCGIGATLLGFNDDDVSEAVIRTVRDGSFSTLNPVEEVELAERLCAIHPWAKCARFARCGGETAAMAIRIARAATGRSKVIISGYHGWQDWYLAANLESPAALGEMWLTGLSPYGVPQELRGTGIPCLHGDFARLEQTLREQGNDIAAIIAEPCRHEPPSPGFLEALRQACDQYGITLIFDEITIGWRYRFGGAHLSFGVNPDLAIFSKALGNGHPIGAVIGNEKMRPAAEKAFLSSTYWTERVGPAAALATIAKMEKTRVAEKVTSMGERIMRLWHDSAAAVGLPLKITSQFGCLPSFSFTVPEPNALRTLYTQIMLEEDILTGCAVYPTLAHGEAEFSRFAQAVKRVFAELAPIAAEGPDCVRRHLRAPEAHVGFQRLIK